MVDLVPNYLKPLFSGLFTSTPQKGSTQGTTVVIEKENPPAKIADNLAAVQANCNIKRSYPLPVEAVFIRHDLQKLLKSGKITQSDYDRIINGKSEVSYLLANDPHCLFVSFFNNYLRDLNDRESPILTTLEGDSFIYYYTGLGYCKLNKALRNGETLSCELETVKKGLISALDQLPDYKGPVCRVIKAFDEAAHLKAGDIYNPKEFLSTKPIGVSSTSGYKFMFVIEAKNGKCIDKISTHKGEEEILFRSDSKFKVLEIKQDEDGAKTYYMEEI